MKLKTVEINGKTYSEVEDGKPVVIYDDGREASIDIAHTHNTIARLNAESKTHREAKEAAEVQLKVFKDAGIEDVDAAKKALETVANLNVGDLKTAAQVEEIKTAARKAAEEQVVASAKASGEKIKELESSLDKVTGDFNQEKLTNAFSGSKYLKDKVAWAPDVVQKVFGDQFKREDGKLVGYHPDGSKIFSRAKPGEVAEFDEALELAVDSYPHRDQMLKSTASTGSGMRNGRDGKPLGPKTMTRQAFRALDSASQMKAMTVDGVTVVD